MNKQNILDIIENSGIVAVIRLSDAAKLEKIIDALSKGGVKAMEITMTTPNALGIISQLSKSVKDDDFIIGVGSVTSGEMALKAIEAGARFVVSPIFKQEIVEIAHKNSVAVIPGCFTPTEIQTAWEAGADVIKVFPATRLGPSFLKDVRGPLPHLKLTPTGGVDLSNAGDFIKAGAVFLGAGSSLLDKKMIENEDWDGLAKLAAAFVEEVSKARS